MFTYKAKVVNVVDGDTIDVIVDLGFSVSSKQRIRLAGIDTPERGQDGYTLASSKLTQLILDKEVELKTTKPSKYGYYLGEIYINGTYINNLMIELGLAKPYFGGTK